VSTSSTFQTFGILGFVRSGMSIGVKYPAVLHHLVVHRCRTNRDVHDRERLYLPKESARARGKLSVEQQAKELPRSLIRRSSAKRSSRKYACTILRSPAPITPHVCRGFGDPCTYIQALTCVAAETRVIGVWPTKI
jgi:hypothetical protein